MQHSDVFYTDRYEIYEDQFNSLKAGRKARRKRNPEPHHTPKRSRQQVLEQISEELQGDEVGFKTTYHPSRHEEGWLLDSIRNFYEEALINDVLAMVRGGKEASVYRCAADPSTGVALLAAKVYRPRQFRNLRNDALYRGGREILTAGGHAVRSDDHRTIRAIGKKSAYGVQVSHTSWLTHELVSMQKLHDAGGAVPKPYAGGENAILMSYVGDERTAAPTLNNVRLEDDEAEYVFEEVMRNVKLMLTHNLIHGDLSAYNILYWDEEITLIDFPQVVNAANNDMAYPILLRDVQRICEYFDMQRFHRDPEVVTRNLWQQYGPEQPNILLTVE
ncbi:MAG: hypothetical protein JXA21_26760 [Anaerolineae bacterium]|nr:hypothetical protein [Anaerolineae bacterium]